MPTYPTNEPDAPAPAKKAKRSGDPGRYLRRARAVLLYGPIEPKLTREITAQVLMLDQMSAEKPIRVYVNSPGGVADDGFAIYDLLKFVRAPVYTIVAGMAASAATIVLLGAPKGHRLILPHARVMLHQPSTMIRGSAADIAVNAKELIRLRKKSIALYSRETGRSVEQIEKELQRDYWMSADEAVAYRIVDRIVNNYDEMDHPA
jgi:ATP-dependent Clp protease protease subunit